MTFKKGNKQGRGWKMCFGKGKPKPKKEKKQEQPKQNEV
jgi:hypothetical protein